MSWTRQLKNFFLVVLISAAMLEIGAHLIVKYRSGISAVQKDFIFKQVDSTGKFTPNKDYVFPIRENAKFQWVSEEFSVEVRTNSFGLREDFDVKLSEVNTVFFGDSFTFGHGVEADERFSAIYAINRKLGTRAISLSYKNGFQPEHYEFYFRNNLDLKPKRVFVGLYLGNDLGADVSETVYDLSTNKLELPYRRVFSDGQVGNSPIAFRFPLNVLADRSSFVDFFLIVMGKTPLRAHLFHEGFEGPNSPNTIVLERGDINLLDNRAIKSLVRLRELVEERGGSLTVVLIPQNYFFGEGNSHVHPQLVGELSALRSGKNLLSELLTACKVLNLKCFDTRPYLARDSYFAKDAHWNAKGHREVGMALAKYTN